jgi:hypothetical protein
MAGWSLAGSWWGDPSGVRSGTASQAHTFSKQPMTHTLSLPLSFLKHNWVNFAAVHGASIEHMYGYLIYLQRPDYYI